MSHRNATNIIVVGNLNAITGSTISNRASNSRALSGHCPELAPFHRAWYDVEQFWLRLRAYMHGWRHNWKEGLKKKRKKKRKKSVWKARISECVAARCCNFNYHTERYSMQRRYWQRLVFFDGAEVVCLEVMVDDYIRIEAVENLFIDLIQ